LNRKLFLLNLLLLAALGAGAWQLRRNWEQARRREQAVLARKTPPAPVAAVEIPPVAEPVRAEGFADVAERMVFAKDRNPNVVVEEKVPDPVPPFPAAYGFMDLGAGATVFLSERPGQPQKGYRKGDKIGPFEIAELSREEITLAWRDKTFEKKLADLKPKVQAPPPGAAAAPSPAAPATPSPAPVVTSAKELEGKLTPKDGGPGLDVGAAQRACSPSDTSPPGTVTGGFKKVVYPSPFGSRCMWEPVR
jgi:hypothetical protein